MSTLSPEQNDLIRRYLLDEFNEEQKREFEVMLLDSQELLSEVQRQEAMIRELKREKQNLTLNGYSTQKRLNFAQWVAQPLSIAASLIFAVLLIAVYVGERVNQEFVELQSTNAEQAIAHGLNIVTERQIDVMRGRLSIIGNFPMLLEFRAGPQFSSNSVTISIMESDDTLILNLENLSADENGIVRMIVESPLSGEKNIRISSQNTQSPPLAPVLFEVVFQDQL